MPKWNPRRLEDRMASPMTPVRTHEEVGAIMGIAEDVSRRTEQRALKKLRRIVADMGLTLEDFTDEGPRVFVRERV